MRFMMRPTGCLSKKRSTGARRILASTIPWMFSEMRRVKASAKHQHRSQQARPRQSQKR